ncbi:MAG TPA: type II secretion system F family protein [Chlamydiales bacterium]|nr:type II secretion system F family protein [Chlamydiales bacterium]
MPLFRYFALSEKGKKISGTIDADNLQEAKLKLIRREVAVIKIAQLNEKQKRIQLSKSELLNLTREIARLLQAGLPLFETLSALGEKYKEQKAHRLLLDLCDKVQSGQSFSQGLAHHPESFDLLYVGMISNAEKTGRLSQALGELADLLTKQLQVRKQLLAALLYPALLSVFCLVVLSSLLFFVIPSLKELFDGRDLHPFTKIVFTASEWACNAKFALLFFLFALVGGAVATFFSPRWKEKIFSLGYRLPPFKNLLAKVAFVRFCRASATLLEGGLPVIAAFSQARGVMRHPILEKVVLRAEERISQGDPLSAPFQNHPLIPPLIPRMLGIAQEGGKLPFMMQQIALVYEDELERTLSHFATVAQPILLLVLGAIIGFVLLSVLLPMTDISSFATG